MTVETATYINQLNAALPALADPEEEGASHIQLIKATLQATFPSIAGPITYSDTAINAVFAAFSNPMASLVLAPASSSPSTAGGLLSITAPKAGGATAGVQTTATGLLLSTAMGTANGALGITPAGVLNIQGATPAIQLNGTTLVTVPSGVIVMWSGSAASIPTGWVLCNGQNGTPNLQDRFIVGAGNLYAPDATGGSASFAVQTDSQGTHSHTGAVSTQPAVAITGGTDSQGAHNHTGEAGAYSLQVGDLPPHQHTLNGCSNPSGSGSGGLGFVSGTTSTIADSTVGSGNAHVHPISIDGAHTHALAITGVPAHAHTISSDGAHLHNVTAATLPPYFALCFIMKS